MPETQAEATICCESCNKHAPKGLLFCPFCSHKVVDAERDASLARINCPFCHCGDEFSRSFCTVCGAQLNQSDAQVKIRALGTAKRTGFNWSQQSTASTSGLKQVPRVTSAPEPVTKVPTRSPLLLYCASGMVLGLAAAAVLATIVPGPTRYLLARFLCPSRGLVVAVRLQDATAGNRANVRLINAYNNSSTECSTDDDGMLSTTAVSPGNYRMYVTAPGYETAFAMITVDGSVPTLVGFPEPVMVPRE